MKRYTHDINDPKKLVERPHGEWVKYEDIPDAVETDRERRLSTCVTKQGDIINKQNVAVKAMRTTLGEIARNDSLPKTVRAAAKDAIETARNI